MDDDDDDGGAERPEKRALQDGEDEEVVKRRKILEEARALDAESEDDDDDDERYSSTPNSAFHPMILMTAIPLIQKMRMIQRPCTPNSLKSKPREPPKKHAKKPSNKKKIRKSTTGQWPRETRSSIASQRISQSRDAGTMMLSSRIRRGVWMTSQRIAL